ncbi:MAG: ribosomal RNA small subunit methyltransferase A [Chloroflexi bacterium]|nr:MAG: ribosomal RNA small subunit methyltransferase A [Chloroflexota bacterium]MBL1197426.1 ribosomal RNA small subunit methyltransferase A [Chloroflexota bacterium]NOH14721.1 ribosomal RNA small subunit methyltransferase A [Chloroflexota bacterium]
MRPSKSLGQNFLSDDNILARIVEAAGIGPKDTVLEVGPGLGSLTRHLAEAAEAVVAVELDKKLITPLETVLAPYDNVRIVQGDILDLFPADLGLPDGYVMAANIPYYITSALLRHLLEAETHPAQLTLTVQKEVAQRMCAEPPDLSLLALSVQVYGQPEVVFGIPAGAFYPPPKVDSAVVRVALYDQPRIPATQLDDFFRLSKAGFGQKRKTLRNALSSGLGQAKDEVDALLEKANIDGQRRAETLSLEEWGRLVEEFSRLTEG